MKQNNDSPNTPFSTLTKQKQAKKLQARGLPTIQQTSSSHIIRNHATPLLSKFTFTFTTIPFRDESDWHQVEFGPLFCRE